MDLTLFILMLFALQLIYWAVGKYYSRNLQGTEDYFLAGKQVSLFPLMMTFIATQVGGGVILGAADEAYKYGWPVLLYPVGQALGLLLLGSGIGRRLAGFDVSTVAQLFEVVYKSPKLKKAASVLSIVSLFMILVAQIIASSKFLASLGVSNPLLFIAFWGIVILYTVQGGLRAVISTDMVQAAFFSVLFFLCFAMVYATVPEVSSIPMPQLDTLSPMSSKLFGWLLMPLLFVVIEQDMGQRCFAGATPRIVSRASFFAGLCTFAVAVVPVFLGILAKTMGLEIPSGSSVLMTAIGTMTNPWMASLVGCAILAAVISTATSLINAISSNISEDFNFAKGKRADQLKIVKRITCGIALSAIFFAFFFDNIVDLLIQSYELSVSCLFVPVMFAVFGAKGRTLSATLSIAFGAASFVAFKVFPIAFPGEIVSLIVSLAGYGIGEVAGQVKPIRA